MNAADIGAERPLMELGKGLRQFALLRIARKKILTPDFGEQGRGIDQCALGCPTHAGLHFLNKDRQHKPRGDGHDEEISQQ